ncbi:hypothetical protein GEMRC1_001432 [Eukaryota sp. GEM-RC1]
MTGDTQPESKSVRSADIKKPVENNDNVNAQTWQIMERMRAMKAKREESRGKRNQIDRDFAVNYREFIQRDQESFEATKADLEKSMAVFRSNCENQRNTVDAVERQANEQADQISELAHTLKEKMSEVSTTILSLKSKIAEKSGNCRSPKIFHKI